jgi:hypothetical protein
VRVASSEEAELELAGFRPHVLVHNDSLLVPELALEAVLTRVEVTYSDGMEAWVRAGGMVSRVRDMSTEDLLRTVAVAATLGGPD